MRKFLILGFVCVLVFGLLAAATPVNAAGGGSGGGTSGPPGWSHENPGKGGSPTPGIGPGYGHRNQINHTFLGGSNHGERNFSPRPGWSHENPGRGGSPVVPRGPVNRP